MMDPDSLFRQLQDKEVELQQTLQQMNMIQQQK